MSEKTGALASRALKVGAAASLLALAVLGLRWISTQRQVPGPRKVMQFTVVNIQPQQAKPLPPPPPQPLTPPKVTEQEPRTNRVELRPTDIPPPDAPPPSADPAPGGGRLSLAAEGAGPGDAFNLAGNPGGRGILGGGALGDGTGDGQIGGSGAGGPGSRHAWYYSKLAIDIEDAFRRQKDLVTASTRVEVRVWVDASGTVTRVQLVRSTGSARLDQAIESVVGLRHRDPPPADLPMPMILRLTARRPE